MIRTSDGLTITLFQAAGLSGYFFKWKRDVVSQSLISTFLIFLNWPDFFPNLICNEIGGQKFNGKVQGPETRFYSMKWTHAVLMLWFFSHPKNLKQIKTKIVLHKPLFISIKNLMIPFVKIMATNNTESDLEQFLA